ncbi:MAG: ribbon-helix-helix protein, CopG family [Desulfobacterales bacterium]|nr:ribbon-helix-helix protein, CopG family [Desulfobacterales bacterium]
MNKAISVRIPDELASRLNEISVETQRSKSFHVQKAIEAYLAEMADLQVALDRLQDPSDAVVSLDDIRQELDL